MNSSARRVTVCIPFFNHHQYLENLLAKLSEQTYPDFEVIVVNDGSSRESSQEFDRIAESGVDRRIRFLRTDNLGPGAARNLAARKAAGDLLLFFDADNVPKNPEFIATLVRGLEASNADCMTCGYDIVSSNATTFSEQDITLTCEPLGDCVDVCCFENLLGDATMIMPASIFEKAGGFPTHRACWEDFEFLLGLCFKGFTLETWPESMYYYRQDPMGRELRANRFLNFQSLLALLESAPSRFLMRILMSTLVPDVHARSRSRARNS